MQLDNLPKAVTVPRVLLFFILELSVLHISLFVKSFRPGPRGWTTVQYLSLCLALLGLLSAVASSRQTVAKGMIPWAKSGRDFRYGLFKRQLEDDTVGGLLCRKFVRSAYSPPPELFDRSQRRYDAACLVVREFATSLPQQQPADGRTIPSGRLGGFHSPDELVEGSLDRLRSALAEFNDANVKVAKLEEAQQNSEFEDLVTVLTPYTLALALAFQFWKTSAERWFPAR